MLTAVRQVSEGKQTNRITLETLCGLFRYASWIDIESDTCFRNITWGSLPVGCQGVMREREDSIQMKRFVTTKYLRRGVFPCFLIYFRFSTPIFYKK